MYEVKMSFTVLHYRVEKQLEYCLNVSSVHILCMKTDTARVGVLSFSQIKMINTKDKHRTNIP